MAASSVTVGMVGVMEWLIVAVLGGGVGLPMGIPPQDPDPMMTQVAPEKCLYYTSWAGMAKPAAESNNQTEQLFAEPEVRKLVQELERVMVSAAEQAAADAPNDEAVMLIENAPLLAKTLISHPTALFLEDVQLRPRGLHAKGAVVVKLGEKAEDVVGVISRFLETAPPDVGEKVAIEGMECTQLRLDANVPLITVGCQQDYLIIAVGEQSFAEVLERARTLPPQWLTEAVNSVSVPRMASFTYLDIASSLERVGGMAPPNLRRVMDVTGLTGLTTLVSVTGLDETGFVKRTKLGSTDPNKGLGSLVSDQALTAENLSGIPADASVACAFKLDLQRMVSRGIEWIAEVNPRAAEQLQSGLRELEQPFGISLEEDLLAALGDVWTLHTAPSSGGLAAGWTITVDLKDRAKAQEAHEKLLKVLVGLFAQQSETSPAVRSFSYGDQAAYTLEVPDDDFFAAPSWCLTDTHLVVTVLPQSLKSYLAGLDADKSLANQSQVAELLEMKNGPCSLAYQDVQRHFVTFYPFIQYAAQMAARELRQREAFDIDVTALPSIKAVAPHLLPSIAVTRKVEDGFESYSHGTLPGANLGASAPVAAALLLPAVQSAREAARRAASMNNLKQLGLSMHIYHDKFKAFPAAYSTDEEGKPLLSWRVHVLPFLEQDDLYERFHLDEPWNSEHNRKLIPQMPKIYRSPRSNAGPGKTVYLANAAEDGFFVPPDEEQRKETQPQGTELADIRDGTSNTIMLVEANHAGAVTWTKPGDFEMNAKNPFRGLQSRRRGTFLAVLGDGSVRAISTKIDVKMLKALFTRDGAEWIGSF